MLPAKRAGARVDYPTAAQQRAVLEQRDSSSRRCKKKKKKNKGKNHHPIANVQNKCKKNKDPQRTNSGPKLAPNKCKPSSKAG
jgi:hypothetical protein